MKKNNKERKVKRYSELTRGERFKRMNRHMRSWQKKENVMDLGGISQLQAYGKSTRASQRPWLKYNRKTKQYELSASGYNKSSDKAKKAADKFAQGIIDMGTLSSFKQGVKRLFDNYKRTYNDEELMEEDEDTMIKLAMQFIQEQYSVEYMNSKSITQMIWIVQNTTTKQNRKFTVGSVHENNLQNGFNTFLHNYYYLQGKIGEAKPKTKSNFEY